jgi:hypothetical protein
MTPGTIEKGQGTSKMCQGLQGQVWFQQGHTLQAHTQGGDEAWGALGIPNAWIWRLAE